MEKHETPDPPPPYSSIPIYPGTQQAPAYQNAPPNYATPPPGYQQYPTAPPVGFVPSYGSTQTNIVINPPIITIGACPACRIGILEDDFTCLGILCAILFFPLGILCCLFMKNRRCSNCGAYFG